MMRILLFVAVILMSAFNSYGIYTKSIDDSHGYVFQCHGKKSTMDGKENQMTWADDKETANYIVKVTIVATHLFVIEIYRQVGDSYDFDKVYRSMFDINDYEIYADEFSKSGLRFNFKRLGPLTLFSKLDCMKYYPNLKDTPNDIVEKSYKIKEVYPRIELFFSDYKFFATIDIIGTSDGNNGFRDINASWIDVLDYFKNKLEVPLITK